MMRLRIHRCTILVYNKKNIKNEKLINAKLILFQN